MESGRWAGDDESEPSEEATPSRTRDQSGPSGEPAEPEELSPDIIFEVLKNERRRLALKYLSRQESTVSLGTLAEHIAAIENDKEVSMVRSNERKRVYVGLYQCHLPKMDDMGIVEFNRDRGLIELTDRAEQLYEYMDAGDGSAQDRWYRYYGGLSVLALAGTALVWTRPLPAADLVLTGIVAAFVCCSMLHLASAVRSEQPSGGGTHGG